MVVIIFDYLIDGLFVDDLAFMILATPIFNRPLPNWVMTLYSSEYSFALPLWKEW